MHAGTALSFEGRTGTGGQLGHGNDFDYWSPHHVEWLQLTETDLSKQVQGGELAWRVLQVSQAGQREQAGGGWEPNGRTQHQTQCRQDSGHASLSTTCDAACHARAAACAVTVMLCPRAPPCTGVVRA